jgi:hypothetical protein
LPTPRSESGSRAEAETAAATDWTVWQTAVAELVALQATVGASAAEVRRQLEAAEVEAGQVGRAVKAAHSALGQPTHPVATMQQMHPRAWAGPKRPGQFAQPKHPGPARDSEPRG